MDGFPYGKTGFMMVDLLGGLMEKALVNELIG